MLARRLISIPLFTIVALVAFTLSPLLLLISFILSFLTRLRSLFRATCFVLGFLICELAGWFVFAWIELRYRNSPEYIHQNYRLQYWWANSLLRLGTRCFSLTFELSGEEALQGRSAILIARHASIGDNVIPLVYFGMRRDEPLRYILKQELTWLPNLDIGGHRLPNLFVDRSGTNTDKQLEDIEALLTTAGDDESVFIYPEGTRHTPAKRARLKDRRDLAAQLERWPDLLPPRLGGICRLLEANTHKDVVFLCHTGFEGASTLGDLANGQWVGQHIRIHLWRIPYEDIPSDHESFIFEQWDRMQQTLVELRREKASS